MLRGRTGLRGCCVVDRRTHTRAASVVVCAVAQAPRLCENVSRVVHGQQAVQRRLVEDADAVAFRTEVQPRGRDGLPWWSEVPSLAAVGVARSLPSAYAPVQCAAARDGICWLQWPLRVVMQDGLPSRAGIPVRSGLCAGGPGVRTAVPSTLLGEHRGLRDDGANDGRQAHRAAEGVLLDGRGAARCEGRHGGVDRPLLLLLMLLLLMMLLLMMLLLMLLLLMMLL